MLALDLKILLTIVYKFPDRLDYFVQVLDCTEKNCVPSPADPKRNTIAARISLIRTETTFFLARAPQFAWPSPGSPSRCLWVLGSLCV